MSKTAQLIRSVARRQSTTSVPVTPARCPFRMPPSSGDEAAGDAPRPSGEGPAKASGQSALSFEDLPTPKGLPLIGSLWDLIKAGAKSNLHRYCSRQHQELGPMYRQKLGVVDAVFVADPEMIKTMYLNDGPYPRHLVPEPWLVYNKLTNTQRGLFFMDGVEWHKFRQSLNTAFSSISKEDNSQAFNAIIGDVMERWKAIRETSGELLDIEKELYRWSIESLGAMIFGHRMGFLEKDDRKETPMFVDAVQSIFNESVNMSMIPAHLAHKFNLPTWRRFAKAVSKSLSGSQSFVTEAMQKNFARAEHGLPVKGMMGHLMLEKNMNKEDFAKIVNDLIIAAAHTTAPAAQWNLYLLAKNGDWQQKVLEEVQSVVPEGEAVGPQHLNSLPLVRAVVKESLRMYPVAPFLTRYVQKDMILGNYHIPKGQLVLMSMFTLSRDPKHFPDPDEFNPDRWIRKPGPMRHIVQSHACLPFGLGSRACIGRFMAEELMQLMMARAVQNFKLEVLNKNDIDVKLRMISMPSEDIRLRLTDRNAV